ncbi:hypothetical protein H310_12463 [Aphanomyces invadans]|uniref:RCC1-like domain-containing protein n=1 Tax=Aphanomyces invadans TaxID=157072 RepID=A0A024TK09_9STRA|nr:hypothetical protein H310_12463 [Aphanomyces invadans]ETV93697.1 hypothetical protein H310_12463 [Aphanomyces invadans]|eukprot:XP_008877738.1 hypothetical protein H310_12463 [Aphanomyces invadans]
MDSSGPHPPPPRVRVNSRLLQASANLQAVNRPLDDVTCPTPSSPTRRGGTPTLKRKKPIYVTDNPSSPVPSIDTPDDGPTLIHVSKTHIHAIYGGTMGFYSIWLAVPCESTVVIHLLVQNDRTRSVRLSASRICFTPTTYGLPQAVGVQAVDVTRDDDICIQHRVFSQDERFDQLDVPPIHVKVFGNEAAFVWSFGGDAILQDVTTNTFARRRPLLIPGMKEILPSPTSHPDANPTSPVGNAPPQAPRDVYFSSLACGENFTVVASSQSCLAFAFGQGTDGELGNHASFSSKTPCRLPSQLFATPQERPAIVSLSCGKHHVAVATRAGQLFTWGSGRFGQLGHCNYLDINSPKPVQFDKQDAPNSAVCTSMLLEGTIVTSVACGGFHTLAITDVQHVLAFGHNKAGQLGFGHRQSRTDHGWRSCVPCRVDGLLNYAIHQVAAGVHHSACISTHGDLFTWGCGVDGRLGHNSSVTYSTPTLVVAVQLLKILPKMVRCGGRHSALISDTDQLYTWGANDFGQLGVGDVRQRLSPALVTFPTKSPVLEVSLGHFHSAAINARGDVWTWGYDINGGLGMESDGSVHLSPCQVTALAGFGAVQVQCGWSHTTVLTKRNHPMKRTTAQGSPRSMSRRSSNQIDIGSPSIPRKPVAPDAALRRHKRPQSATPRSTKPTQTDEQTQPDPPPTLHAFHKRMQRVRPQSAHPRARKSDENQPAPAHRAPVLVAAAHIPHPYLRKNHHKNAKPPRPQTARLADRRPPDVPPRLVVHPTLDPRRSKTSVQRAIAITFVGRLAKQVVEKVANAANDKLESSVHQLDHHRLRSHTALYQRVFTRQAPVLPITTPRVYCRQQLPQQPDQVPEQPQGDEGRVDFRKVAPPTMTLEQWTTLVDSAGPTLSSLSSSDASSIPRRPRPKSASVLKTPLPLALSLEIERERKHAIEIAGSVLKEAQYQHHKRLWLR